MHKKDNEIKIIGHRGGAGEALENTLDSFLHALNQNIYGIEFDIRMTKDGVPVILHDPDTKRLSFQNYYIAKMDSSELVHIKLKNNATIPTLESILKKLQKSSVVFYIELKVYGLVEEVTKLIDLYGLTDRVIIKSFLHKELLAVKEKSPQIRTACLLSCSPIDPVSIVKSCRADFLSIDFLVISKDIIDKCNEYNIKVISWCAENVEEVLFLKSIGVEYILTDYPQHIMSEIDHLSF